MVLGIVSDVDQIGVIRIGSGLELHLHGQLDGISYPPAHRMALSECVALELVRLPVARSLQLQTCQAISGDIS